MLKDGYCMCLNAWSLDTRIKNELPLLLIISSLSAKTGTTFASNKYFAELFDCTETSISLKIKHLYECGYLEIDYEKRGTQVIHRNLRIKNFLLDQLKNFNRTDKKNLIGNNTSVNNTSVTNNKNSKKVLIDEYFNFGDVEEVREIANTYEIRVLDNLQKFLVNTFFGQEIDVDFIQKQAERFSGGTS